MRLVDVPWQDDDRGLSHTLHLDATRVGLDHLLTLQVHAVIHSYVNVWTFTIPILGLLRIDCISSDSWSNSGVDDEDGIVTLSSPVKTK